MAAAAFPFELRTASSPEEASRWFRSLADVAPGQLQGEWLGRGLHTGHPLDGVLEAMHWHGKRFDAAGVHPLLLQDLRGRPRSMPGWLVRVGLPIARHWPALARSRFAALLLRAFAHVLATRDASAQVRKVMAAGVSCTAIVYDSAPVTDLLRQVDADTLLGRMEWAGDPRPLYFLLRRAGGVSRC